MIMARKRKTKKRIAVTGMTQRLSGHRAVNVATAENGLVLISFRTPITSENYSAGKLRVPGRIARHKNKIVTEIKINSEAALALMEMLQVQMAKPYSLRAILSRFQKMCGLIDVLERKKIHQHAPIIGVRVICVVRYNNQKDSMDEI